MALYSHLTLLSSLITIKRYMGMDNKKLIEEMKDYFKVSSLEDVALKLGYSKTTASTWRTRGITQTAINKYKIIKSKNIIKEDENSQIAVNLYKDIFTSAGYGTINSDLAPIKINLDKDFLKEVFNITDFKNLDIIRVTGDSMLPHIKDGEYVFVQKGTSPKNGDTIIANIDGELYIKRYHKLPFEKWFRLESDNNEFPNIEIDTDDKFNSLIIVGIVKSKIKLY